MAPSENLEGADFCCSLPTEDQLQFGPCVCLAKKREGARALAQVVASSAAQLPSKAGGEIIAAKFLCSGSYLPTSPLFRASVTD